MKVAYLVNGYPRTSHSFIRREIRALESLGVEVLRFCQRPLDEPLVSEVDREEYRRTRVLLAAGLLEHAWALLASAFGRPMAFARTLVTAIRLGGRSERGVFRHLVYFGEAALLERWLRGTGVSHLHAHFGANPATVALLCRSLGGPPFSFTIHGVDEYDNTREKTSRAAFALAVSSFGRAQIYRRVDLAEWPKVHEVHCGVEEDLLSASLTRIPDAPKLVCVARLSAEKGHMLLLEAAARLAAEGLRFEIVLVGDGPLRATVEVQVRRLGLERCVRIAGWMSPEKVRETIVAARALVLPSFTEGLPVVLMEAFALGRPVIASALSGIPELVKPGVNGWLVPAASIEELAAAMREALQTPPARLEAMGRAGSAFVAEHHDSRKEAGKLLALLRAATGEVTGLLAVPSDASPASPVVDAGPRAAAPLRSSGVS